MAITETRFKTGGKTLPKAEIVNDIAAWIIADKARHSFTYTLAGKGDKAPLNVHYVARHADAIDVLRGKYKDQVTLTNYDDQVNAMQAGQEFLLGAATDLKARRWTIFREALAHPPKMQRTNMSVFEDVSARAVQKTINLIRSEIGKDGNFNAIREYGFLVPYFAALDFTGMSMTNKVTLMCRMMMFARNWGKGQKVRLKGDMAPASQLMFWSQMIFGHAFSNIDDRSGAFRWAAKRATKQYMTCINECLIERANPPEGSLAARFKAVRHKFPESSDELYRKDCAGIIYELAGTITILVGISFSNILSTVLEHGMSVEAFLKLMAAENNSGPQTMYLDEALRLSPTMGQFMRRVKTPFSLGDRTFEPGDLIYVVMSTATRDPDVFPEPDKYSDLSPDAPRRDLKNYLNFGPNELTPNSFSPTDSTHPCFGQYWARDMMHKMMQGLGGLPGLKPEGELKTFAGTPDELTLYYETAS